jgi:hypothetical protein
MFDGRAADAIPKYEQTIRLDPRNAYIHNRYQLIGYALRECPANGGMTTQGVRSVGSIADRGNGDAMGVAVDCDGG